jgi:CheY-like chemotaxis protein
VSTEPPVVLYAEDNFLWMRTVKDVLELLGCLVEHRAGGAIAWAALRSAKERGAHYDLILLDNDLSSMSGLEVTRHARQMPEWQHTPIILLALEDCTEEALEAGADECLRKPNNLITLADTVRRLLAAKAGTRPKAKGKSERQSVGEK